MPNVASNVVVGKPKVTGGILMGPLGTPLPVNATVDPAGFTAVGYVTEEGVTQEIAEDREDIKAWGGDIVRKVSTSHDVTYAFGLLETNEYAMTIYYGADNVSGDLTTIEGLTVLINSKELDHQAVIFEIEDGTRRVRIVLPDAQVTERGEVTYQDSAAVAYSLTITAYPDALGNKAYMYVADSTAILAPVAP